MAALTSHSGAFRYPGWLPPSASNPICTEGITCVSETSFSICSPAGIEPPQPVAPGTVCRDGGILAARRYSRMWRTVTSPQLRWLGKRRINIVWVGRCAHLWDCCVCPRLLRTHLINETTRLHNGAVEQNGNEFCRNFITKLFSLFSSQVESTWNPTQ